jgi:hypothetical protein
MVEAKIKLTKTMLDKSIIDANKTVREFLEQDFGMSYDDKFFTEEWWDVESQRTERAHFIVESQRTERAHFIVVGEYADGTEADVKFYRSVKRGDKRISIQKLKQYAEVGDEVILTSDAESLHDGYRIHINIVRQEADATG